MVIIGAVIGVLVDRKKFHYQTKSSAKSGLISSLYGVVGEWSTLKYALINDKMSDDQYGQLRWFSEQINIANASIKGFGINTKNHQRIQELITNMNILGVDIMNSKRKERTQKELAEIISIGDPIIEEAKKLANDLQKEFDFSLGSWFAGILN